MIRTDAADAPTNFQFEVLALEGGVIKDFITQVIINSGFELVQDGDQVSVLEKFDDWQNLSAIVLRNVITGQPDQQQKAHEDHFLMIDSLAS